jgi:hypothetical protein
MRIPPHSGAWLLAGFVLFKALLVGAYIFWRQQRRS